MAAEPGLSGRRASVVLLAGLCVCFRCSMMRGGPSYDDNYISRKMSSYQSSPTFLPPGRGGSMAGYSQVGNPHSQDFYYHPIVKCRGLSCLEDGTFISVPCWQSVSYPTIFLINDSTYCVAPNIHQMSIKYNNLRQIINLKTFIKILSKQAISLSILAPWWIFCTCQFAKRGFIKFNSKHKFKLDQTNFSI